MAYEIAYAPAPAYSDDGPQPVSRTYQYRKVMKPMLERKRRARINRCLDELKDLMVSALQAEGGNVAKLEKADILELTVKHLQSLRRKRKLAPTPTAGLDRFRAGFTHAAAEVSRCLAATPGVDVLLGTKLMTHLGHRLNDMDRLAPLTIRVGASSCSSASSSSSTSSRSSSPPPSSPLACYGLPLTPACSPEPPMSPHQPLDCSIHSTSGLLRFATKEESVWRPW